MLTPNALRRRLLQAGAALGTLPAWLAPAAAQAATKIVFGYTAVTD